MEDTTLEGLVAQSLITLVCVWGVMSTQHNVKKVPGYLVTVWCSVVASMTGGRGRGIACPPTPQATHQYSMTHSDVMRTMYIALP